MTTSKIMNGKSLVEEPIQDPRVHNNIGNTYIAQNRWDLALQHYREVLNINPNSAEACNNLGRCYYLQGLFIEALPFYEKAIRLNALYWEAHYNLAHNLVKLNRFDQAKAHYKEALKLNPQHINTYFQLGFLYTENQEHDDAIAMLTEGLRLDPSNKDAACYLGDCYLALGNTIEAIQAYKNVMPADAGIQQNHESINLASLIRAHHNLGILYLKENNKEQAIIHFKAAVNLDPNNATAQHMINALSGTSNPTEPPKEYVKQLFDQYASYYDDHVKRRLKYNVPFLLRSAVGKSLPYHSRLKRILDLGCGTGLCGVYFRDLALDLVGVDISPKMIEHAKALNAYETVTESDIYDYLQNITKTFDIILAGDVLVYMGDLSWFFELSIQRLAPDGLLAFSVENTSTKPYVLQSSGRFAHHKEYIQDLALQFNLNIQIQEEAILRYEEDKAIMGYIHVLNNQK